MSTIARVIVHAGLARNPALVVNDSSQLFFHVLMSCIDTTVYDYDADHWTVCLVLAASIRPVGFSEEPVYVVKDS